MTSAMRVLLDCRMASWSGVGRYTTGLARALAARDDIELVQLVSRGELAPVPDRAEVIAVAGSPLSPLAATGFARVAREVEPDVVHCAHFPTPIPTVHPLVVTIHDLTPMVMPQVMPSRLRRGVWTWWNRRAAREADLIAANSQHTASDVRRLLPAAAEKVRVVLHALDVTLVREPAAPLPDDLAAWLGDGPFVLSMGNTKPNKDLPTLLAAFQLIVTDAAAAGAGNAGVPGDLRLVLVGRGEPDYLEGWLTDRGASGRARFTGPVTDGQLRTLYERAAVFAFPSRYEGFGLPPLEAMGLGTPAVVADAASLPEVVGDAALLVEPGDPQTLADALARVLTDPTLAADLAARGRERAAGFSWERTAQATVEVYREAVAAR